MDYKVFLKNTLPQLGLRWRRFRGKTIRRRVIARLQALGLNSLGDYHRYLFENEEEQRQLTGLLTVTISRFWRNQDLFQLLANIWIPALLERLPSGEQLQIWSAGCASGEEPYSLLILWQEISGGSGLDLRLVASDADNRCLHRAKEGRYPASSFRELPVDLRNKYCANKDGTFSIPQDFPDRIIWVEHDLVWDPPILGNHLIFCRNLVYTYFTDPLQLELTSKFHQALHSRGLLIVGRKDRLQPGTEGLFQLADHPIYERVDS